ncbi:CCA tRNA nucleotidyltransferase [Roseibium litorale]|uniref:CCA tRNA nucleotidyltransferase n=1 Tax=Roseibium litorale TaxID=2803841 RepID=A0ABR9CKV2_9HYPH|nr:CCA tRNA nucleotidyltransferase [Roseibium litorale]MBD8891358.1 CCA tRNA nucleotidyltransferase [Roseibium litorale]
MSRFLENADWLHHPSVQAVFAAVEQDGDEARVVGGAVRNSLLGEPAGDIDIATTALPQTVMQRAKAAGLKPVPTGIDHGTVTIVSGGRPYEVTTLREDVETFGRQAKVHFGRDWTKDALRRDFTLNALYAGRDGQIHDPLDGLKDCLARKVRFIGDAEQRIREDYLRILRFFRIHASYGHGDLDPAGLAACTALRHGIKQLSGERIGAEMKRLVLAPLAAGSLLTMQGAGILPIILGGVSRPGRFRAFRALKEIAPEAQDPALNLAALAGFVEEDGERLARTLRLSNAERDRMVHGLAMEPRVVMAGEELPARLREFIFLYGKDALTAGLLLQTASGTYPAGKLAQILAEIHGTEVPVFPVSGSDLIARGVQPGPEIGVYLKKMETIWIADGLKMDRDQLLVAASYVESAT